MANAADIPPPNPDTARLMLGRTAADAPQVSLPGDHAMLELPFSAEIDGRHYQGDAISLVGARLSGLAAVTLEGQQRLARLIFDFAGFSLAIPVRVTVTRVEAGEGRIELSFTEPAGPHLPQLRHVLNSYIAGDVVNVGDSLGVALQPRKAAGASAAAGPAGAGLGRRIVGYLFLGVASAALLAGLATLAEMRLLTLPVAEPARIVPEGQTLMATAAGQIDYLAPGAKMGEVAYSIRATSGQELSVAMPCDCTARPEGIGLGSTVEAGQPVLRLTAADAPVVIEAQIDRGQLFALASAGSVRVTLADGRRILAHADPVSLVAASAAPGQGTVPVRLTPNTPVGADAVGQLAKLTIEKTTFVTPLFQSIRNLMGFGAAAAG